MSKFTGKNSLTLKTKFFSFLARYPGFNFHIHQKPEFMLKNSHLSFRIPAGFLRPKSPGLIGLKRSVLFRRHFRLEILTCVDRVQFNDGDLNSCASLNPILLVVPAPVLLTCWLSLSRWLLPLKECAGVWDAPKTRNIIKCTPQQ